MTAGPDKELSRRIQAAVPDLLLLTACIESSGRRGLYKFYSQSFKVFHLQVDLQKMLGALRAVWPERDLNPHFIAILNAGLAARFDPSSNGRWAEDSAPVINAFLHARIMLAEVVACDPGNSSDGDTLAADRWATVRLLYNLG